MGSDGIVVEECVVAGLCQRRMLERKPPWGYSSLRQPETQWRQVDEPCRANTVHVGSADRLRDPLLPHCTHEDRVGRFLCHEDRAIGCGHHWICDALPPDW